MSRHWQLTVEDFGRIARADVQVAPFTVLVGPNNSGKSYLASLIWGAESGGLADEAYARDWPSLTAWLQRAAEQDGEWVPLSAESHRAAQDEWDAFVTEASPAMCRRVFNADVTPRATTIRSSAARVPLFASAQRTTRAGGPVTRAVVSRTKSDALVAAAVDRFIGVVDRVNLDRAFDAGLVWFALSTMAMGDVELGELALAQSRFGADTPLAAAYQSKAPIFLPAARTGFSLFLSTFMQTAIPQAMGQANRRRADDTHTAFTLPQTHLMTALASGFGGKPGPFADEAARLERECLAGAIVAEGEFGVARYGFRPEGGQTLGLPVSSALVTELLPLVVALRNAQEIPFLVLEEPEAHLHPRLQRAVIRCLARLVRRGVKVLITTHSATVAQQVNNLVKLGALNPAQRPAFGYDAEEYLTTDEVAVHEFVFGEGARTTVAPIVASAGGFAMPTFNAALGELARETLDLNAALEPEGAGD